MGLYSVIRPRAATNLITNPSAETADTGYTGDSSTAVRSTAQSKFGVASINVTPTSAAFAGMYYAMTLSATTTYTFSFWAKGNTGVAMRAYAHDVTAGATLGSAVSFTGSEAWQYVTVTFTTGANTSVRLYISKNNNASTANYYVDGLMLITGSTTDTYIDGDIPGCLWNGARHASTSTRSAASRNGGEVIDLESTGVYLIDHGGGGMPPTSNITSDYGLLPGATYQRTKVLSRLLTLTVDQDDAQAADAFQALHDVRRDLIELFDPFGVEGSQPTILRYTGGSQDLELDVFYDAGLEGGSTQGFIETATLRLLAPQPFWRQIGNAAKTLSVNESIANANYIVQRDKNGIWRALTTGVSGGSAQVLALAYGPDGSLYVGGSFTSAGGVANTSRIARWDDNTSSWSALGTGFNGAVYALAFDAAGNLYAGGAFTDAAYPRLAMWNGSAWSAVGSAAAATGEVHALLIDASGNLVIGGNFVNWNAIAAADGIVLWNGSAYSALGTGVTGEVFALARGFGTTVYVGGNFGSAGGVANTGLIAQWSGSNWLAMGSGFTFGLGMQVEEIAVDSAGIVYAGGNFAEAGFSDLARFYGGAWVALGSGVSGGAVYALTFTADDTLIVGGSFSSAGSLTLNDRLAGWRAGYWGPLQIDLPGSAVVSAIASYRDGPLDDAGNRMTGRIALGFNTAGTATASNASDTTVTNNGSAPAAPVIQITGPGNLQSIINMTTGRELAFNSTGGGLYLHPGEVATLDLRPGQFGFSSTFRPNLIPSILASHPQTWRLRRGDNTVLVKMASTTGTSAISVTWQELHWSYDV